MCVREMRQKTKTAIERDRRMSEKEIGLRVREKEIEEE